jgi:hypothetical protein
MKENFNLATLLTTGLTALKSIFNIDKRAMSVVCIKVQDKQPKSPHHYLHRK